MIAASLALVVVMSLSLLWCALSGWHDWRPISVAVVCALIANLLMVLA